MSSNKGVNLPGVNLDMEYLSDTDKSDLLFGIENKVDYVAASFVRRGDDVEKLRSFLDENGEKVLPSSRKLRTKKALKTSMKSWSWQTASWLPEGLGRGGGV